MRVSVTQRRDLSADLRSAGEAAPSLAFPWVAKLRYGLLAGESALILAAHYVFGVQLPILWLTLPVALAAVGNPLLERFTGAVRDRHALGILLTLDTLCLTALLSLTGGPANPFTLLYLVQITLSAVILSKGGPGPSAGYPWLASPSCSRCMCVWPYLKVITPPKGSRSTWLGCGLRLPRHRS
jgi:two-component system sensor histidine kinase RegB